MKHLAIALPLLLALVAGSADAQGVQTSTLRGLIRNQEAEPMANATVMVTSPSLQGSRATRTLEDGSFALALLPAGEYSVRIEATGIAPVSIKVTLPLGGIVEQELTLHVGAGERRIVTATAPSPVTLPTMAFNVTQPEVEAIATTRDLAGVAQLSPGVSENTPNPGQLIVNGAFAYDNVFMANGVDVNDNQFGNPQSLFIEDAIQETQTLTSGVPAEYGRFTGGVVNTITKSGGNIFSGSVRLNLTNPSWTSETPFEEQGGFERPGNLSESWEGTLGGPIVADRLWFFGAGRAATTSMSRTLPQTNDPQLEEDRDRRSEIKITAAPIADHVVQFGYLTSRLAEDNYANFPFTIDRQALLNRSTPNWYAVANYRGTVGTRALAEAQYSERRYRFVGAGGTSTAIVESPFITETQELGQYNAPFFDALDEEERNNRQITGNLTSFFERAGPHQLKVGYEWFRSNDIGGSSPSATGVVFLADYVVDGAGSPVRDAGGRLMPQFVPGNTQRRQFVAERGASLQIDTGSLFLQDHWAVTNRLSADIGARLERVNSIALPSRTEGVSTTTLVPRLAAAYDIVGDSRHIVRATYGWYAGRFHPNLVGASSSAGNPDMILGIYNGPPGAGRSFSPGFDPSNYETVFGAFTELNSIDPDLRSPIVREFSMSYGHTFEAGRGYADVTYLHRGAADLIDDFVEASNGFTVIARDGGPVGVFTNVVWKNTDLARRVYDGVQFQTRYRMTGAWSLTGHYTLQLRNDGNYEGEGENAPGLTSPIGDYPGVFTAERHYPDGRLQDFQRHRLRVWSIYNHTMGTRGDVTISGLWRYDSGRVYSIRSANEPFSETQFDLLTSQYPDFPASHTVFFGERGSETFDGASLIDAAITYQARALRSIRPYVKLDVFNLFNNRSAVGFNTAVIGDPDGPRDELGLPTQVINGPSFGQPDDNRHFPVPFAGATGGRTVRIAVGVRF